MNSAPTTRYSDGEPSEGFSAMGGQFRLDADTYLAMMRTEIDTYDGLELYGD